MFIKKEWKKLSQPSKYRRLSLSQSPGDQTKYFELSVVWDSQFVTSFTLYMYTDCLDHRDYNLHVHVFGNDILQFKYPLTELLICHTNFDKAAAEIKECWWLLTSKNVVKQCSITKFQRSRYIGYNRMHLTVWLLTISVIIAGQLNVYSWLSMSLCFIGV